MLVIIVISGMQLYGCVAPYVDSTEGGSEPDLLLREA